MFELFDPRGDLRVTAGNLPHWYQPGVTYFVTFRTEDSLPVAVADLWYRRRNDWLQRHGLNASQDSWRKTFCQLPDETQTEFHKLFSVEYLENLDKGHGQCVLKNRQIANEVADSLLYFDGERYHLGDFIVMPNHVHLLVCLLGDTDIEQQCYSWKKFTATKINQALGRRGRFWQEESFDHLVRSSDQFERLQKYIAENGPRANLPECDYLYSKFPHVRN